MDCKTIVRALYPERFPDRPVRWEAAYRWLADVGVPVVYIAEDGDTDVRKAERTGCWGADFPTVLAYKEAYYAQIAMNDWTTECRGRGGSRAISVLGRRNDGAAPACCLRSSWTPHGRPQERRRRRRK